mgnify:CR=1 FL=1
MSTHTDTIDEFVASDYKYGFVTDIESESLEPGLNEDVVRFISAPTCRREHLRIPDHLHDLRLCMAPDGKKLHAFQCQHTNHGTTHCNRAAQLCTLQHDKPLASTPGHSHRSYSRPARSAAARRS